VPEENGAHTMTRNQIAEKLALLEQGSHVVLAYVTEEGESRSGVVGVVTDYWNTAQGKRAKAEGKQGKCNWEQVPGLPFGILFLKSNPEKLALGFSKSIRNEKGQFCESGWRTLNLEGLRDIQVH
jgi:hypothetical protein